MSKNGTLPGSKLTFTANGLTGAKLLVVKDESGNEYHVAIKRLVLVVNEEGKDYHGKHITNHGTDRSPCREGSTVCRICRNQGQKRTVRYVCDGVESIPDYVTCNEDNELSPNRSAGEGQEATSTAHDKSDGTEPDVL